MYYGAGDLWIGTTRSTGDPGRRRSSRKRARSRAGGTRRRARTGRKKTIREMEAELEGTYERDARGRLTGRKKKRRRTPAARRSSTRRTRAKGVVRYDPDTLERVTVPKGSVEADEYLTAAQARTDRRARTKERTRSRKELVTAVKPIARTAIAAATARTIQLGQAARAAGAVAGLSAGATAAAVAAALGVGYAIGTGLRALWKRLTPTERNARKALAFIRARREFAARHGRAMTADEVRAMGRGFLQSIGRSS